MRISKLAVIVFAATQVTTAPFPFSEELRALELRGNRNSPTHSSFNPVASTNWARIASSIAQKAHSALRNSSTNSSVGSGIRKAIQDAVKLGSSLHTGPCSPTSFKPTRPQSQETPYVGVIHVTD